MAINLGNNLMNPGRNCRCGYLPDTTRDIFLAILLSAGSGMGGVVAAAPAGVPPGYSAEKVEVKFRSGTNLDLVETTLAPAPGLQNSVDRMHPLFDLPRDRLKELRHNGKQRSGKMPPDLNSWYTISLKPGTDALGFAEELKHMDNVESVQFAPLPAPPPAVTPDFTGNQGYLGAATDGVDAQFAWTIPGGNGAGIRIFDVEYSWHQTHEDLSKANGLALLLNPGDSASDPFSDDNHGTAVLGEIVADNDTKGVTGISWGSNLGLAPANTINLGYNPANAILLAVAAGSPGDVILIEQQAVVCGLPADSYGPTEWIGSVFDAIQTATANRFVVVEAAGNGNVNLDQAACGTTFNRNVRDSGAIIVGAGGPPGGQDRQRLSFSSYGSRVDIQGWGEGVTTTGYGTSYINPDDPTNRNFWYTNSFSGTSSASPIIAGAVADLQGIALNHFGVPLTAFQLRQLLVDTGSPQLGNTAENIGPRPNLREGIRQITEGPIDLYYSLSVSKSGRGTVTSSPTGINCGSSCSATYTAGSSVTLSATPAAGYTFSGWSSACSGSSTCTVTMNNNQNVTATFAPIKYTLSVTKTNAAYGTVTSSPTGINCGSTCSAQFNTGTSVKLTAKQVRGRKFAGWTGSCRGTALTCTLSMTQNKRVNAAFK